ncbi:hypothetical protein [Subtercola endophyticus]|uniref:hypothetical protein n=1 Tax=Subtercola endophyticus TaxID=2895559 RepID=UPI001E2D5F93|nr:hypothetical protein [Subtercola endophyticus]UFS59216.1 hypothetical protein LQ955_19940 [Subtercola endophyticus]
MLKSAAIRVAAVGVVAAALIGGTSSLAQAATPVDPTVGSAGPVYVGDANDGSRIADGATLDFDYAVIALADPSDLSAVYTGSADATSVETFISPRGSESDPSAWTAWSTSGFLDGTKNVQYPTITPGSQINGNQNAVRAGGNWSIGFAFLKDNNLHIAGGGVYFTNITVAAGGNYQFATPTTVTPPAPASGSFDQNLSATTIDAQDGTLNLVAPANATTTLGAATLVNNLSTSTGNIGKFTVQDGRVVTHKGWDLTTSVTDFTNSADSSKTIDKKNLGVAAVAAAGTTLPAGVTLAAAQIAGSAVNPAPFASAAAGTAIAATDLDAALTLVAPANTPAGTYTAKLTVTLASK